MDKNKNAPSSPMTPDSKSEKSEKKEPLSLEELLAKKKAEELARSKVCVLFVYNIIYRFIKHKFVF